MLERYTLSQIARTLFEVILNSHDTLMKKEMAYEECLRNSIDFDVYDEVNKVKYLGHGVFVQNFTSQIVDNSSYEIPSVITRRETRNVSRASVKSLFEPWNEGENSTVIVGIPGIGKSRGTMMFTATVVILAYKR
jgi:hypothetical protein